MYTFHYKYMEDWINNCIAMFHFSRWHNLYSKFPRKFEMRNINEISNVFICIQIRVSVSSELL